MLLRGRTAYAARLRAQGKELMGVESVWVVTRVDFLAHTEVCLEALEGRLSFLVLDARDEPTLLICRHRTKP